MDEEDDDDIDDGWVNTELVGPGWVRGSAPKKGCIKKALAPLRTVDGTEEVPAKPQGKEEEKKSVIGAWLAAAIEVAAGKRTIYSPTYVQTPKGILVSSPGGWVPPNAHPHCVEQAHLKKLIEQNPVLADKPPEVLKAAYCAAEVGTEFQLSASPSGPLPSPKSTKKVSPSLGFRVQGSGFRGEKGERPHSQTLS